MTKASGQRGGDSPDFPPTPFILQRKSPQKNNVLVGTDPAQTRFLEQMLRTEAEDVERVTDDMLTGQQGRLYRVYAAHRVDVSPEVRGRTGFWSADPVAKGSAAIHALVRYAASLVSNGKLTRETLELVGNRLVKKKVHDLRGLLWHAVWMLSDEVAASRRWAEPWESPGSWLNSSMNPEQRLHTLYWKLVGYSSLKAYGEEAARKVGLKPVDIQKFKDVTLDSARVYSTLALLSRFRQGRLNPWICALQISAVWL